MKAQAIPASTPNNQDVFHMLCFPFCEVAHCQVNDVVIIRTDHADQIHSLSHHRKYKVYFVARYARRPKYLVSLSGNLKPISLHPHSVMSSPVMRKIRFLFTRKHTTPSWQNKLYIFRFR
jgi:hypothetical protein